MIAKEAALARRLGQPRLGRRGAVATGRSAGAAARAVGGQSQAGDVAEPQCGGRVKKEWTGPVEQPGDSHTDQAVGRQRRFHNDDPIEVRLVSARAVRPPCRVPAFRGAFKGVFAAQQGLQHRPSVVRGQPGRQQQQRGQVAQPAAPVAVQLALRQDEEQRLAQAREP